jgi:tetratricopeptide (TPR) repeat protein
VQVIMGGSSEEGQEIAIAVEAGTASGGGESGGDETAQALLFLGAAAQKGGDAAQAVRLYTRALDQARRAQHILRDNKGDADKEKEAAALSGGGTPAECLRARAAAHAALKDFDSAIRDGDEAVQLCSPAPPVDTTTAVAAAAAGGESSGEDDAKEMGEVPLDTNPARIASLPGKAQRELLEEHKAAVDGGEKPGSRALSHFRRGEALFMRALRDKSGTDFEKAADDFAVAASMPLGSGQNDDQMRQRLYLSLEQCEYYKLHCQVAAKKQQPQQSQGSA